MGLNPLSCLSMDRAVHWIQSSTSTAAASRNATYTTTTTTTTTTSCRDITSDPGQETSLHCTDQNTKNISICSDTKKIPFTHHRHQRVWKASYEEQDDDDETVDHKQQSPCDGNDPIARRDGHISEEEVDETWMKEMQWNKGIHEMGPSTIQDALDRIGRQEQQGGRMRQRQKGVLREDPKEDMRLLVENYTVPALASALREREDTLQLCASLIAENRIDELTDILRPYGHKYVELRRQQNYNLDLTQGFHIESLEMIRRGLMKMPRRVSTAHRRRAGVVLPLCNVHGTPCILFEKRSKDLRAHPDEVCLPGGMVSTVNDRSIVSTCLREMSEEIVGLNENQTTVLGVLRCNWGEVHNLVGIAVTPVVCYIGEIGHLNLKPNPNEVAECFTVPLSSFLVSEQWMQKEGYAPIFIGGPHLIWGLTGYIVNRFVKDVLARYRLHFAAQAVHEKA